MKKHVEFLLVCLATEAMKKKIMAFHRGSAPKVFACTVNGGKRCPLLSVILSFHPLNTGDSWLADRQRKGMVPSIHCCTPIAGDGHRESLTSRLGAVVGGAWLPCTGKRLIARHTKDVLDEYLRTVSPPLVNEWVENCRRLRPTLRRGEPVPVRLTIPDVDCALNADLGVYFLQGTDSVSLRLWKPVPLVTQVFEKPTWSYKSQSSAINHLDEVWEIKQRMEEYGNSFTQAFESSFAATLFICTLRYPRLQSSHLPLSPRLASFLLRCLEAKLGREGCIIACILECGAASFDVQLVGQIPMIQRKRGKCEKYSAHSSAASHPGKRKHFSK